MLVSEDSSIVRSKIAQILLTMIFGYLMNVNVPVASNLSFRGGDDETAAATAYCDDESQCRCWMVSAKIAAVVQLSIDFKYTLYTDDKFAR